VAAARYLVVTPQGQEIQVGISETDMLAVPIPRPIREDDFSAAINRRFPSLAALDRAIEAAGGRWTRLL
jgi:hypothetical protein